MSRGKPENLADGLNARQEQFVHEYLKDLNAAAAARRAGYSERSASQQGYCNLRHPIIQQRLAAHAKKMLKRIDVDAERILRELACIAFTELRDICTWSDQSVTLTAASEIEAEAHAAVKKVKLRTRESVTEEGKVVSYTEVEVELHDKLRALERLGEYRRLFSVPVMDRYRDEDEADEQIPQVALMARDPLPPLH